MPFRSRCERPLELVSQGDVEQIHQASLQILETVGVKFLDDETVRFLADHGCRVEGDAEIVRFPPELVEACLATCPPEFRLRARNPRYDILFDRHSVQFSACSGMAILDLDTMKRRPGTLKDAVEAVRLCDALENIAGANPGLGYVADKPVETNLEWLYATAIRNSEKVTAVGVMEDSEKWGIRMAQAAGEDIIVVVSSASPLGWTRDQIVGARRALEAGMPVGFQSMASPGATGPATLVGSVALMNAEVLAMMVLAQLLRPGSGILYSCFTIPLDMRTTTLASGSIELGMMAAVSAQLARRYRMGSMIFAPMSDAKLFDQQAGYEKGMGWLLAGMAGINLIWGAGMVEGHGLWSNAQLLVDAEMCGMVGRYLQGVGVNAEALALEVIETVGHMPHTYLDTKHTRDWWKGERYLPMISSREAYDRWVEMGSQEIMARADEKARALLEAHEPVPLPAEVDRELERLLGAAAREKGLEAS
jgi:trimethylamine--corrinoid protein Co-methyltransferase